MLETGGTSAAGDAAAARVEALLAERGGRLRALAQRLLGADADDGMQEVLLATVRSLPSFRGEARLSTWFHRLALRVLCSFRRRRDRRDEREPAAADVELRLSAAALRDHADSPLQRLSQQERRERVLTALQCLTPLLREVLLLRGEGLTHTEIAEVLQVPLGTVKSRMTAALAALAERLPDREDLLP